MVIYYDGNIYGIRWQIYDSNKELVQKYEKIYIEKMSKQNTEEVKQEYNKLTQLQLSNAKFSVYTTEGEGICMGWVKYDKDVIYNFINFLNNY